jgi:hypothetical protein
MIRASEWDDDANPILHPVPSDYRTEEMILLKRSRSQDKKRNKRKVCFNLFSKRPQPGVLEVRLGSKSFFCYYANRMRA